MSKILIITLVATLTTTESYGSWTDNEKGPFFSAIRLLLTEKMDGCQQAYLLKSVAKLPADERKAIVNLTKPLLTEKMDGRQGAFLLKAVAKLPADEREAIIDLTKRTLITKDMYGYENAALLKAVAKLPADEREAIIDLTKRTLITKKMDGCEQAYLLLAVADLPLEERKAIIELTQRTLITKKMQSYQQAYLLEVVAKLPADEREAIVTLTKSTLITKDMSSSQQADLLNAVADLPLEEGKVIIELTKPLLTEKMDGDEQASLLFTVAKLPLEERKAIIELTQRTLLTEKMNAYQQADLLKAVAKLPADEREKIVILTKPLLTEKMDGCQQASLLKAVVKLPAEKREVILDLTKLFITEKMDIYKTLNYLERVAMFSAEVDLKALTKTVALLDEKKDGEFLWVFLKSLPFLPSEYYEVIFDYLQTKKLENRAEFNDMLFAPSKIFYFLIQQGSLGEEIYNHWIKIITTVDMDDDIERLKKKKNSLINLILDPSHMTELGLYAEHEVVQEAIRVQTLLDGSDDPLNPFNFFASVKEKRDEDVDLGTLNLPHETEGGVRITVDPYYIQDMGTFPLLYRDVPTTSKNFFSEMLSTLEAKAADPAFKEKVLNATGYTYDQLKDGALGSSYLQNIHNDIQRADPKKPAPFLVAQFGAILFYIESLENDLPEEGSSTDSWGLMPREDVFLKMLASVQRCTIGKKEGIFNFYNALDEDFKLKERSEEMTKGLEFVHSIIKKVIRDQLSGTTPLFKHLIGMKPDEDVEQAVHQATYVKNVIGRELSITDKPAFDNHTQCLYEELVEKPKAALLQAFYTYTSPNHFVSAFLTEANKLFTVQDEHGGQKHFPMLQGMLVEEDDLSIAFTFDLTEGILKLTYQGASKILTSCGLLKEVPYITPAEPAAE